MPRSPITARMLAALALATILLPMAHAESDDPMEWTSRDGVTIRARLAGLTVNRVILVRDGRFHEVPLEVLSPESISKAKRLLDQPAEAPAPPRTRPSPILSERKAVIPGRPGSSIARRGTSLRVRTTAYAHQESDHTAYGNRNALGTPLRFDGEIRSAAADWSVYPVGTRFRIKGLPDLFIIDDYGSTLVGSGTIDLYHPDLASMRAWGCRNVEITIERWGSPDLRARILASRLAHDHCRLMFDRIVRSKSEGNGCL